MNAPATPPPNTSLTANRALTMQEIQQLPPERQFAKMLESFKSQIALALPSHLTPERMVRLALSAFKGNAKLAKCSPTSLFSGVILASQLGLEIGVDGQAFLVPYKDKNGKLHAQLIPGWKGYVTLVNNAKQASIWTGAVFEGDKFEYQLGANPKCDHRPTGQADETKANLRFVYAIGWVHGAQFPIIEVWPVNKVIRHLARNNKVGGQHYALANDNNFIAYGRKVALLQVVKYLPKSVELRVAQQSDQGATFDLASVIEGEFATVEPPTTVGSIEDETGDGGAGAASTGSDEGSDGSAGTSAASTQATAAGLAASVAATQSDQGNRANNGSAQRRQPRATPDSSGGKSETPPPKATAADGEPPSPRKFD
jgi:recombination protein RecT